MLSKKKHTFGQISPSSHQKVDELVTGTWCLMQILKSHSPLLLFPVSPSPFLPPDCREGNIVGKGRGASFHSKESLESPHFPGDWTLLSNMEAAALYSWQMLYSLKPQIIPENESFEINTEEWDLLLSPDGTVQPWKL